MKQSGDKINLIVSSNNIQNKIDNPIINIDNPNINIHNPDINIPSSVGTVVGKTASSVGIGATIVAGMRAMYCKTRGMTSGMRAVSLGLGGLLGGVFVVVNSVNTYVQKNINNYNNFKGSGINGPFFDNSIIEEGDSVESTMNLLYNNLFINICILFLSILLLYFYKNKKEI